MMVGNYLTALEDNLEVFTSSRSHRIESSCEKPWLVSAEEGSEAHYGHTHVM